jgi:hypothetical protein
MLDDCCAFYFCLLHFRPYQLFHICLVELYFQRGAPPKRLHGLAGLITPEGWKIVFPSLFHTPLLKSDFALSGCILISKMIPFLHNIIAFVSSWDILTIFPSVSEGALHSCYPGGSEVSSPNLFVPEAGDNLT